MCSKFKWLNDYFVNYEWTFLTNLIGLKPNTEAWCQMIQWTDYDVYSSGFKCLCRTKTDWPVKIKEPQVTGKKTELSKNLNYESFYIIYIVKA
jgi:hypothetical protein